MGKHLFFFLHIDFNLHISRFNIQHLKKMYSNLLILLMSFILILTGTILLTGVLKYTNFIYSTPGKLEI